MLAMMSLGPFNAAIDAIVPTERLAGPTR